MSTYTISLKGDTTENWEASNRVLVKNEVGVERDDNDNVVGIKIGDGVKGWNSLGYAYGQYSETPVRIGTWVDGTPIWRQALMIYCKDMDEENYGYLLNDKLISVSRYLSIRDMGANVYVLDSHLTYGSGLATGVSPVDDTVLEREQAPGDVNFVLPDSVISSMPKSWAESMVEGFYGYVDFSTPESNIKTGDAS